MTIGLKTMKASVSRNATNVTGGRSLNPILMNSHPALHSTQASHQTVTIRARDMQ